MALTVVVSLLGLFRLPALIDKCLFRPYFFLRRREYATIISSGFVHADVGHLLFNMFTFYFFAFPLERFLGTPAFLTLYVTGLLISHGCTFLKHRDNANYASLGASGVGSFMTFLFTAILCAFDLYMMNEKKMYSSLLAFDAFLNPICFMPFMSGFRSSALHSKYDSAPCFIQAFAPISAIFLYSFSLFFFTVNKNPPPISP